MKKAQNEAKATYTYTDYEATEDIKVRIFTTDRDFATTTLIIETAAGEVYISGWSRKAKSGNWFFCAPSHKDKGGKYQDDVFFKKEVRESINNAINAALG